MNYALVTVALYLTNFMHAHNFKNPGNKGFTLIELLVTLAIIAIVAAIGLPNFTQTITRGRITTNANQLVASLNIARSEAIKRGVNIFVEKIGGASQVWDGGWNVFVDLNANQTFNAGTDTLIKTYPPLSNGYTLRTGANYGSWVSFSSTGTTSSSGGPGNDTFRLCDSTADTTISRAIIVNAVGRARVSTGTAGCP